MSELDLSGGDPPSMPQDYALLGWLIIFTGVSIGTFVMLENFRRKHPHLMLYNQVFYLYGMLIFGLIGSWSAFIAQDHLREFSQVTHSFTGSCALWSYWFLHVLGINMWISIMIMQVIDRLFCFHHRLYTWSKLRKFSVRTITFLGLQIVPVIIAANVSYANLSQYSPEYNTCESSLVPRFMVMSWYLICLVAFRVILNTFETFLITTNFRDFSNLNNIWSVAVHVFTADVCINLFDVSHHWYGRVWYTFNITFLFGYTIYRTSINLLVYIYQQHKRRAVKRVVSANGSSTVRYDPNSEPKKGPGEEITNVLQAVSMNRRYQTIGELPPALLHIFFRFAERKTIEERGGVLADSYNTLFNLINCLEEIERWKSPSFERMSDKKKQTIMSQYLDRDAVFYLHLPDTDMDLVRAVPGGDLMAARASIVRKLMNEFYGKTFMQMVRVHPDEFSYLMHRRIEYEQEILRQHGSHTTSDPHLYLHSKSNDAKATAEHVHALLRHQHNPVDEDSEIALTSRRGDQQQQQHSSKQEKRPPSGGVGAVSGVPLTTFGAKPWKSTVKEDESSDHEDYESYESKLLERFQTEQDVDDQEESDNIVLDFLNVDKA